MISLLKKPKEPVKESIGTGTWKVWAGGKYYEFYSTDKDASKKLEEIMTKCRKTLKF